MNRWILSLAIAIFGVGLGGCGSSNDALRVISNNQVRDVHVDSADCIADATTGFEVDCFLTYRFDGVFGDRMEIIIYDVRNIFDHLNAVISVGPGTVDIFPTLQGRDAPVVSPSQILFTEITNAPGGRISAEFDLTTGYERIMGKFTAKVRVGGVGY